MAVIDREGMPLSPPDWMTMLKAICSECQSRIVAAQEDNRRVVRAKPEELSDVPLPGCDTPSP